MKKIYLAIITMAVGLSMSGQTLTQANNAPSNGDTYSTQQCDSLNVDPGMAGSNAVWTFTNLNIHASSTSFSTVASTTSGYPSGCQATGSSPNDLGYTVSSANNLNYYGGNLKVSTVVAQLTYSSPAIYAIYPMSLNSTSTSVIGGSINITSATGNFSGNSSTLADGSGTLILPGTGSTGTFSNVLRVLTIQTLNYNVLSGFGTGVITQNTYNYYSIGIKAALLTISTKTVTSNLAATSTQSIVTVNKDYLAPITTTTGLSKNISATVELSVYPNPSSSYINFSTENQLTKDLLIYDITGKIVEKQNFNNGKIKLDVSGFSNGFYLYSILNNNGEILKTGKVAVNH